MKMPLSRFRTWSVRVARISTLLRSFFFVCYPLHPFLLSFLLFLLFVLCLLPIFFIYFFLPLPIFFCPPLILVLLLFLTLPFFPMIQLPLILTLVFSPGSSVVCSSSRYLNNSFLYIGKGTV